MADEKGSGSDKKNSDSNHSESNGSEINRSDNRTPDNPVLNNEQSGEDKNAVKESVSKLIAADKPASTSEKAPPSDLFSAKPMPKMASKKTKRNWLIPSLVTFLVIIALLASGWTLYQQQLFNQNWAEQQTKIETQFQQQNQIVEQAKNSGQASVQAASQSQLQLHQITTKNQQLNDSLLSTQEKIKALSGRQKQDWMLAEAAYLIKISQLQLVLQKDKQTAIQLLKTADRRITEIADNSLFPIREAIAKDLSELSLILEPDITGIALALNAINQQIPSLSLLALQFEPIEQSLEERTAEEQGFDLEKIYQNFLKDFVVIKDHSEPVKPLMTADQRVNLNSNIQLAIQQAQIALVRSNSSLYRLNISNAIQWTDLYFKHDDSALQVVEQLNNLKTKPIEVHYPNKLHAQKALDEISQQQLYHWLEGSLSSPVPQANIEDEQSLDSENNKTEQEPDTLDQSDEKDETGQQNMEGKL